MSSRPAPSSGRQSPADRGARDVVPLSIGAFPSSQTQLYTIRIAGCYARFMTAADGSKVS